MLTRRITLASTGVALLLVTIKALVWAMSGSIALLASAADSALDLLASLVTFFAVRYAASPPDAEHRFGHGKAEAFASLMQGGLVFASAALVGREAVMGLIDPQPVRQERLAVIVMAVSTALTFGLISAQSWVLKRTASVAVAGDRAHYATDLASTSPPWSASLRPPGWGSPASTRWPPWWSPACCCGVRSACSAKPPTS